MEEQNELILEKLKYRNTKHNYKQIFNLKENNELQNYYNIGTDIENECFYIEYFDRTVFDYFFYQPIKIQYCFVNNEDDNDQIEFNNIYSTEQIEKYNKDKKVKKPYIAFEDNIIDYDEAKIHIYKYIKNNILIITKEKDDYEDNFIFDDDIIRVDKFEKERLSKYFDNYFIYNKKEEKDFEYDKTDSRKSLMFEYLNLFILNKNLRFFKFCGPSSTGKSTTLLKYSREQRGIVYLNLKAIHELDKNNRIKECYNLITYELRRLYFSYKHKKESFKKFLNEECRNKNPWEIILDVIKFISDTPNIIIFDQFKKSYFSYNFYIQIKDYIKNSKLKLIICSTTNNKDIRDEVIKTIEEYKGNPQNLDDESQYYYFYFWINLFNKKVEKDNKLNPLFELFDYKPKYKYLLSNTNNINECIKEIKSKINKKIKEFFRYEKELDMCKILLDIKNNINIKLSYDNDSDMNILKKIPLKYFIIRLNSGYFEIDYDFKFIKYLEKEIISKDNYFKLKKYDINVAFKDDSFDSKKEDNIKTVNNLLNEENIITQEDLENQHSFKNLNSYDNKKIEGNENKILTKKTKRYEQNENINENSIL